MRGLVNLGNTCYFNTAIQCLAHVPALSRHLFSVRLTDCPCQITREYQSVAKQLFLKDHRDPVNPQGLFDAFRSKFPQFAHGQHDAQEVILVMIDVLEKSLGKDIVTEIFNGQEEQVTIYPGGRSTRTSPFTTLLLDVKEPCRLEDLLKERDEPTAVSGYTDDSGKTHHVAAIQNRVANWPKVFGFSFSMYDYKFPVEIPLEFEGRKLFACVIHHGMQQGGHYALLVKRWDKWYMKDDESVSEVPTPTGSLKGVWYQAWYRSARATE